MTYKTELKQVREALNDLCKNIVCEDDAANWYEKYRFVLKQALQEKLERLENGDRWRTDIENAPKDTPILCLTDREKDPFTLDGGKTLTTFATQCEFSDVYQPLYDGEHVCEFGGEYFEQDCGLRAHAINVKGYWFIHGTDFTYVVHPTHWQPLPLAPKGDK